MPRPRASTVTVAIAFTAIVMVLGAVITSVVYVNGVLTSANHVTANIPIVAIYPSFVCQSAGTNDPIMHIQSYRIFQLR